MAAIHAATAGVIDPVEHARIEEVYGSVYLHWNVMTPAQQKTAKETISRMGIWRQDQLTSHVAESGYLQKALPY